MGADLERTAIMRLQEAANMSERFYYTSVRANAGRTEAARKDNKAKLGNRAGRVSLVDRGRRFTGAD